MADRVAHEITRPMGKPLRQARAEIKTMIERAERMCRLAPSALADEPLPAKAGFRRFMSHVGFRHLTRPKSLHLRAPG